MLNKQQHIDFWIRQAEDDYGAAEGLLAIGKFIQALFWAHLVCEKYAKAIWIKHNKENVPPKTHNIAFLISRTGIEVPMEITELMLLTDKFNIEGRYPEYMQDLESISNKIFAEENFSQINLLITWLKKNLQ